MDSTSRPSPGTGTRIFLVLVAVISVANAVDFLFYGHEPSTLLASVGFALMGYGAYRNGFRLERRAAVAPVAVDRRAGYANMVGIALVLASFVLRLTQ